ncbi:MAG: mitochondrial ribosomal large subunit component [Heterodermia speciosa]|uniref:Mitochondrial ribosomal large subunit component n=1 Tax=Heterodermia speciosa TaxID=116794 RepID=A0A8H3IWW1_9LECA|nr:MAG: mitochondrial ribosomal large subunit component [Heterodermia speciosa]
MKLRTAWAMSFLTPRKPAPTLHFRCPFLPCTQRTAARSFTTTPQPQNWLAPRRGHTQKNRKGRPRVPTGGSTRGTTVVFGDWGLRMRDHDRRVSAAQLNLGAETIKRRLRGQKYRLYTRVCANIGVYTSGNEMRMGKGKGSFDHWASRVAVNKVLFEIKGELHEEIVRDAFRLAGNKMPGLYEFVRRGDPPMMGMTKLENGLTREEVMRPRMKLPPPALPVSAGRLPATTSP